MTPQDTLARFDEIRASSGKNKAWVHVPALLALVAWQQGEIEKRNELLREANAHCGGYGHTEDCKWATTGKCGCNVHTLRKQIEEAVG